MTEKKKKPEAKKASTTQRYSDVAKELGLEVKALLALADQFVEAHPDFKDLVYAEGKKPAASSNFSKFYRDDFMKFAEDKLPKKEEPAPVPAPVAAPAAPAKPLVEAAKPAAPVTQTATFRTGPAGPDLGLGQVLLDRTARDELDHDEGQRQHTEQGRNHQQQAF
jgi:hypothetical protein